MSDLDRAAEAVPVIVAVKEPALAVSIEMTVQALGLPVIVHDPAKGLGAVPLDVGSTLVIDHQLIRCGGATAFLDRLRAQRWRGLAILLTEEAPAMAGLGGAMENAIVIEKPFLNSELVARLRLAHPDTARADRAGLDCVADDASS